MNFGEELQSKNSEKLKYFGIGITQHVSYPTAHSPVN